MASAKDIFIKPINSRTANEFVKKTHYSGKVVQNSQLHFGVFLESKLEGVMQLGSPTDKRKMLPTVSGTEWSGMIELNRMAFSDNLPRFSESRAIGICFRIIKKQYPQIKWVISFSDGCQCGDGTIYRAGGFSLIGIKENSRMVRLSSGVVTHRLSMELTRPTEIQRELRERHGMPNSSVSSLLKADGAESLKGFQLKYIYFLDKSYKEKLTVPILPFSEIDKRGAGMYKGTASTVQSRRVTKANSGDQLECGGAIPTNTLQPSAVNQ